MLLIKKEFSGEKFVSTFGVEIELMKQLHSLGIGMARVTINQFCRLELIKDKICTAIESWGRDEPTLNFF